MTSMVRRVFNFDEMVKWHYEHTVSEEELAKTMNSKKEFLTGMAMRESSNLEELKAFKARMKTEILEGLEEADANYTRMPIRSSTCPWYYRIYCIPMEVVFTSVCSTYCACNSGPGEIYATNEECLEYYCKDHLECHNDCFRMNSVNIQCS